jgi:hypothetical protein
MNQCHASDSEGHSFMTHRIETSGAQAPSGRLIGAHVTHRPPCSAGRLAASGRHLTGKRGHRPEISIGG